MLFSDVRSRIVETDSTMRRCSGPLARRCWIASISSATFIGLTRISSVCSRIALAAADISGNALSKSVTASGLEWRMALTTVRPSPAPGMCRSLSSTSNLLE